MKGRFLNGKNNWLGLKCEQTKNLNFVELKIKLQKLTIGQDKKKIIIFFKRVPSKGKKEE